MNKEYPTGRGPGSHDDSREILVKTPENDSSLRLNAKLRRYDDDLIVWEITLPFEEPVRLVKENNKWVSFGKKKADISLIEAIGSAIDAQIAFRTI